jgi:hypothetical protein
LVSRLQQSGKATAGGDAHFELGFSAFNVACAAVIGEDKSITG